MSRIRNTAEYLNIHRVTDKTNVSDRDIFSAYPDPRIQHPKLRIRISIYPAPVVKFFEKCRQKFGKNV